MLCARGFGHASSVYPNKQVKPVPKLAKPTKVLKEKPKIMKGHDSIVDSISSLRGKKVVVDVDPVRDSTLASSSNAAGEIVATLIQVIDS